MTHRRTEIGIIWRKGDMMANKVLVVDDSVHMRQLITLVLKDEGYDVISAENGREALLKLDGSDIDIVITDLNMPEMDGIEFVKQLRNDANYRTVPVVMITTDSNASRRRESEAAGTTCWINKPFMPDELLDVLKECSQRG